MPRFTESVRRSTVAVVLALSAAGSALAVAAPAVAQPAGAQPAEQCPDVQLVFARGTGEFPGLGLAGTPFARKLEAALPGKTVEAYAVDYGASFDQRTAPDGGTDMTRKVVEVAARCSDTDFVLGGYSQGASATSIALGVPTRFGTGEVIPVDLAPRVAAIIVFGDPLGSRGQTIESESALYGDRARSFCTIGDPVCGGGFNVLAHLAYLVNSSIPDAVTFASAKVLAASS